MQIAPSLASIRSERALASARAAPHPGYFRADNNVVRLGAVIGATS